MRLWWLCLATLVGMALGWSACAGGARRIVHARRLFSRPGDGGQGWSPNGLLAVYKPPQWSSNDAVQYVKSVIKSEIRRVHGPRSQQERALKIGHGGTLDPLAEGVLVLGLGSATKLLASFLTGSKGYAAVATCGTSTDSLDSTGAVTGSKPFGHVTRELLLGTLPKFTGSIKQVPPMYSALKKDGKRLYDLARSGVEVVREPRDATVYSLALAEGTEIEAMHPALSGNELPQKFALVMECSGGFYVRTLLDDFAKDMGTLAHMSFLLRYKQGPFTLDDCLQIADKQLTVEAIQKNLLRCTEKLAAKPASLS